MKRLTTITATVAGLLSVLQSGCGGCSSSNSRQLNAQSDSIMQILEQRYIDDALTAADYAVADSMRLCCHDAADRYNYTKTLLFLGDILQTANDYAEAIDHYREAYDVASALNDHQLVVWACQGAGDLLFAQRMLDESVVWYRRQSEAAQQWGDTLRMAYAAFRMGKALTVEGCADSAAYYYQRAIALAEPLPQAYRIVPAARYKLCDLYIQTHRFEEARQLMTRDTIDDENWAYWQGLLRQHRW